VGNLSYSEFELRSTYHAERAEKRCALFATLC
jgi:hypothetical protein